MLSYRPVKLASQNTHEYKVINQKYESISSRSTLRLSDVCKQSSRTPRKSFPAFSSRSQTFSSSSCRPLHLISRLYRPYLSQFRVFYQVAGRLPQNKWLANETCLKHERLLVNRVRNNSSAMHCSPSRISTVLKKKYQR